MDRIELCNTSDQPDMEQYESYMRIDCNAIQTNLTKLKSMTNSRLMAVLKNDGYGLSLGAYAEMLVKCGVESFAVGSVEEALQLRACCGRDVDILLLTPQTALPVLQKLIDECVMLTVGSTAQAQAVQAAAGECLQPTLVHLMIDTGLGRYGFSPRECLDAAASFRGLQIAGTYTHFSSPYQSPQRTARQFRSFLQAVEMLRAGGIDPGLLHCCASGAMLKYPKMHLDMVRVGSALLGKVPGAALLGLKEAVNLVTPITTIREYAGRGKLGYNGKVRLSGATRVGILDVGNSHGLMMQKKWFGLAPVRQYAKLDGRNVPILGTLGINSIAVDLTDIACGENDLVSLGINPLYCSHQVRRRFVSWLGEEVVQNPKRQF